MGRQSGSSQPRWRSPLESTQDKSERLEREGAGALEQEKVVVSKQSRDVKVLSTEVVQDENGTAAVVRIRNTGKTALAQIPVSIDVRGSGAGKSLFRNDDPGLEPSLVRVRCSARQEFEWVNDQIAAAEKPSAVKAKVGGEVRAPTPWSASRAAAGTACPQGGSGRVRREPLEGGAAQARDLRGGSQGRPSRGRRPGR